MLPSRYSDEGPASQQGPLAAIGSSGWLGLVPSVDYPRLAKLGDAHDHIRDQCEHEEYQQHPRAALKVLNEVAAESRTVETDVFPASC